MLYRFRPSAPLGVCGAVQENILGVENMDALQHYFYGAYGDHYIIQKFVPGHTDENGWYVGDKWETLAEFSESTPDRAYDFYMTWLQENRATLGTFRTRLITGGAPGWKGIPRAVWADSAEGNTFTGISETPDVTTEVTTPISPLMLVGGVGALAVATLVGLVLYKKMKK